MMKVHTLTWAPPFAQGLVRDLRVRWALEEAGLPYEMVAVSRDEQKSERWRAMQPFGQVPVLEDGELRLFESGAILLYLGERSTALLPEDSHGRARATAWMFAALNSVEPRVAGLIELDLFYADQAWAKERRPGALDAAKARLVAVSDALGDRDYLEGRFTAGDLLMTTVLRQLRHTDVVAELPRLHAYQQRCEARPAFQKALAEHTAWWAKA